jgi:hypothetical protein
MVWSNTCIYVFTSGLCDRKSLYNLKYALRALWYKSVCCKRVLGVNNKSTNVAVLSDLGRFPIHYQIIKQVLGYWHHLEINLESSFPLLKAAYNSSKKLFLLKKPS